MASSTEWFIGGALALIVGIIAHITTKKVTAIVVPFILFYMVFLG